MQSLWIAVGALAGLTGVAMAALTAHAFAGLGTAALAMLHSALEMQGWHALALLICGVWVPRGGRLADAAGAAFTAGIVLFCGAVYADALCGTRLAMLAPAGGMLLMLGWVLLGISAIAAGRR
jgi:uncharacterized membrane protein YgdD (TMEM256/DUF423 family)